MLHGDFFAKNRTRLGIEFPLVLTAFSQVQKTNDSSHAFQQESNFWWLTGIEEAGWWVIIDPNQKTWLVQPKVSDAHHIFDGSLSAEEAIKISGADAVLTQAEGMKKLTQLAREYTSVGTLGVHPHQRYFDFVANSAPTKLRTKLKKLFKSVEDARPLLAKLRAIKQSEEIAAIRAAIDLTAQAFQEVKGKLAQKNYEYEVEADFTYSFRRANAHHAYEPIVAFGANACTLHYVKNQSRLKDGLLLLDIGAQVNGYSGDITRTYGVGTISQREREVHASVQKAQQECIELLGPGVSVKEYSEKVDEVMKKALQGLGLLKEPSDYRKYFPHAISHGLGVDVHDSLGAPETFEPGMVLTVEPGIYIPEEGIGVRIEDDILITESGYENLSAALSTDL